MPKYYEEEDKSWKRACSGLREDLKECLANSDCCVKVQRFLTLEIQFLMGGEK